MPTFGEALRELPAGIFADLLEADDAYLLLLDLPGATKDTTSLTATDGRIRIDAERVMSVPEPFTPIREERTGPIAIDLPLPPDASGAGAEATLQRGVLEIRLPKRTAAGGTEIPIEDD